MDNQKKKPIWLIAGIATIVVLAIALVIVMIVKGGNGGGASGLVGKWLYERESLPYVYEFKNDKSGTYGMNGSDNVMKFTYEVSVAKDGDTAVLDDDGKQIPVIEFTYEGNESPMILKYRLEGNDKLIIVDSFGNDTVYNRQK